MKTRNGIAGAVAGLDQDGRAEIRVTMTLTIEQAGALRSVLKLVTPRYPLLGGAAMHEAMGDLMHSVLPVVADDAEAMQGGEEVL